MPRGVYDRSKAKRRSGGDGSAKRPGRQSKERIATDHGVQSPGVQIRSGDSIITICSEGRATVIRIERA